MNFCVAILILNMEENKQHFQHIMLYYFKKGKNATKMQRKKDLCSVWRKCCDWSNVSKVVRSALCCRFPLAYAPCWSGPVEFDSNRMETLIENNQCDTMREIADILKISKSIKLLVKMKNVYYILQKKTYGCFGQPDILFLSTFHSCISEGLLWIAVSCFIILIFFFHDTYKPSNICTIILYFTCLFLTDLYQ